MASETPAHAAVTSDSFAAEGHSADDAHGSVLQSRVEAGGGTVLQLDAGSANVKVASMHVTDLNVVGGSGVRFVAGSSRDAFEHVAEHGPHGEKDQDGAEHGCVLHGVDVGVAS